MALTLLQLADRIPTEADAYRELEHMRWTDQPVCCHCQSENVAYMTPANGVCRTTSSGGTSQRRVWQCRDCRKQFSATTGTVMHGSKVSLRIWLLVIFEMCADKNGISAREVQRKYGVCPRTAWHLLHRIRAAMANGGKLWKMSGTIAADETFIGGKLRNMHASKRAHAQPKTIVLTLINKNTGEARSRVIPNVTGRTLKREMQRDIHPASVLHTDSWRGYLPFGRQVTEHHAVNHLAGEYVRDGKITTNQAENFFSQLKRSQDGTHHHVSRVHLNRYLGEFDYRYSTRELSDTERMARLVRQVGGVRLTYKRVAG